MEIATERLVSHMKIVLSDEALNWFKEEMEVEPGDAIQFFARYGGSSPLQRDFHLVSRRKNPMK